MIFFLTQKMCPGFGVPVVVEQVSRRLAAMGQPVMIGCLEREGAFPDLEVQEVSAQPDRFLARFHGLDCRAVVAHTSPFFELLPHLASRWPCYAWEHGDPTPAFFQDDKKERQAIIARKQQAVYPRIKGVFAISEFVRADIAYPPARVIYNGCDHMPDRGPKGMADRPDMDRRPLTVGTLMRLGQGEAKYKGIALFEQLKDACDSQQLPVRFEVMGRGTEADAAPFRDQGVAVWLNGSESEKTAYLRRLDVFISCSQWEGFNLPLVEAQALGTVGLAFDVGAHPEVTPLVVGHLSEAVTLIDTYTRHPDLLGEHAVKGYHFVRRRFAWNDTTTRFLSGIQI